MKKETRTVVYDDELRIEASYFSIRETAMPVYRVMEGHLITGSQHLKRDHA